MDKLRWKQLVVLQSRAADNHVLLKAFCEGHGRRDNGMILFDSLYPWR